MASGDDAVRVSAGRVPEKFDLIGEGPALGSRVKAMSGRREDRELVFDLAADISGA